MIPSEQKLLNLLSDHNITFFIPPYQRNYEWDVEQCETFWDDLMNTCQTNMMGGLTAHFFGNITYFREETAFGEPDKMVLIDGQQRITTTMILLIAIRDLLEDEDAKEEINNRYLKNNNVKDNRIYKIKLKQTESDWNIYKKIILSEDVESAERKSLLYINYQFFYKKLKEMRNTIDLTYLIQYGLSSFHVISLQLQIANPWENPQEIFESMNSLGKPLSLADLTRNYLLLGLSSEEQIRLYNDYWLMLERNLGDNISKYIRDYMQMVACQPYPQASVANYKTLYHEFKEMFRGEKSEELLKILRDYSGLYASICSGATTGSSKIDDILYRLKAFEATTTNSWILKVLMEYKNHILSEEDAAAILNVLSTYIIRRRLCGLTGPENITIPTLIKSISILTKAEDKAKATFDLFAGLDYNMRLPNDMELKTSLQDMNFYHFKNAKFLLACMEQSLTKSMPDITDRQLTLEHIMPQRLNQQWEEDLGEDYEEIHTEYIHNIGNLTLIRHNSELGNKSFTEKCLIYEENAGLQIAKSKIISCKVWNKDAIIQRRDWMVDILINQVLGIPGHLQRTNNYDGRSAKKRGLSFVALGLIGEEITFAEDENIKAKVVSDKEVEFEDQKWKLSPLTRELKIRNGTNNKSGAYQGVNYWMLDGMKLINFI